MATIAAKAKAAAKAKGLNRYFTGRPCSKGHIAERFVCGSKCVECNRDRVRARRKANPKRTRERAHACYHRNKEIHREARNIKERKRYLVKRDKIRANVVQWRLNNPDRIRELKAYFSRVRRARKVNASGSHTRADLRVIIEAQYYLCVYCRADLRQVKRHVDHIMPLALGGSNDKENLQWLCWECNVSKGHKHPALYLQERGLSTSLVQPER